MLTVRRWPYLLLWILLTALAGPREVRADIYQRVDKDGVIHFTNIAPRGTGWKTIIRGTKPGKAIGASASLRAPADLRAVSSTQLEPYIRQAALLYKLPPSLIRAVMRVESGFHPNVVSQVGAMGLMQLMPATAQRMGVSNPFDPRENIFGGARYLRLLANMFQGDLVLTLAGYNAGENAVIKYGGVPPYDETQRYVRNVVRNYRAFRDQESGDKSKMIARIP